MKVTTSSHAPGSANSSSETARPPWLLPLLLLLGTGAFLGLSTNLVKLAGEAHLPPLSFLTWSVLGSAAVLLLVNTVRKDWVTMNARTLEYFFVAGLVGIALPNLIFFAAVPKVGASFVALSIAFPPLFTYLGALVLGMEQWQHRRALGVVLALSGAALLAVYKLNEPNADPFWILATLCGPVILAIGNIYRTARWPAGASASALTPGALGASGVLLLLMGAVASASGDSPPLFSLVVPTDTLRPTLLILAQVATFSFQFLLFFRLQKEGGPVYLSLAGSVGAMVGVPIAVLLLGESWPQGLLSGGLLIAAGIAFLSWGGAKASS